MVDLARFRQTYLAECHELLAEMEERLLALADEASPEELNAIFRCAHSIKGGAGAFGFERVTGFTHVLETLLDALRDGRVPPTREAVQALLSSVDVVRALLLAADTGTEADEASAAALEAQLKALAGMEGAPAALAVTPKTETGQEASYTIHFAPHESLYRSGNDPLLLLRELGRLGSMNVEADLSALPPLAEMIVGNAYLRWHITLRTNRGEAAIREVFEFVEDECDLSIRPIPAEAPVMRAAGAGPATATPRPDAVPAVTSIRVDLEKIDRLVNMVGELVITQAMLQAETRELPVEKFPGLLRGIDALVQHTRELQEAVMAVRMQPIRSVFARMPRLVHDIAAQLGKDIRLHMSGEDTEVDKTIIEQLADPLTHMIRNAADHGVESPDVRRAAGKPAQGSVHLAAYHQGGRIMIEIRDDGAGLPREKILRKARERGLVPEAAALTDAEIEQLIFLPGFSTAETVSNISGRGVGMDVVKRNITAMGGTVSVASRPGQGSTFTVCLPLTLAILDGMIVRVGAECYIVPITSIIETLRPKPGEVRPVPEGHDVLNVRGEFVPLLYLHALFGVPGAEHDAARALIVLVESGQEKMGLVVDELVGQQQVVIKSLEAHADAVPGISGATILGDGRVSLILDVAGLHGCLARAAAPLSEAA
jgi:two-component system chemotaxis sensor kinase CheA